MNAIVSPQMSRYFEGQSLTEDLVGHCDNWSEQSSDIGRQPGKITK